MDLYKLLQDKIGENITGKLLSSPYTFKAARLLFRKQKFPFQATRMMVDMGLKQAEDAYQHRAPVVWTSAFFPGELIHALGLIPFAPEVGAATAAPLKLVPKLMQLAEEAGFDSDGCSFHRCAAGGALSGYFPSPDLLAASSHLCDGAAHLFSFLSQRLKKPFFCLDVPAEQQAESEKYLADQLEEFVLHLEKETGRKLTREKLRQAFAHSNRARKALLKVNKLRQQYPLSMRSGEGLAFVYLAFMGQGHPRTPLIYESLARELGKRGDKNQSREGGKMRLLWLHLKPYYDNMLMDLLEDKLQCRIAFEEMNYVHWEPLDPEKPFLSLARKLLGHPSLGPIEKRLALIERLSAAYQVQAVVQFSHWGCRQAVGGSLYLKEELAKKGIHFLSLDGDCVDRGSFPPGQTQTRLESFIEMITGQG